MINFIIRIILPKLLNFYLEQKWTLLYYPLDKLKCFHLNSSFLHLLFCNGLNSDPGIEFERML